MSFQVGENQFGVDHQASWRFSLFVGLRSMDICPWKSHDS